MSRKLVLPGRPPGYFITDNLLLKPRDFGLLASRFTKRWIKFWFASVTIWCNNGVTIKIYEVDVVDWSRIPSFLMGLFETESRLLK